MMKQHPITTNNTKSIPFCNGKVPNTNFKNIKKLDLKGIDKNKNETDNQNKEKAIMQNKSDIERETLAETQISKDLEKYIEFLSTEDEICDQLLNYQMPYLFLGINSKQSLSTNQKDLAEAHLKMNDDFFKRIEKNLDKGHSPTSNTNSNNNFHLNLPFGLTKKGSNLKKSSKINLYLNNKNNN